VSLTFESISRPISACVADKACFAVSSDRTARLWALAGEKPECELICKGHQRAVTAVALNDG
jgi:hypothetical protein